MSKNTEFNMPTWLEHSETMTQEELMTALEIAFSAETGMTNVINSLSDLIDTHSEDDFQHWQFISVFEWLLRLSKEHDNG